MAIKRPPEPTPSARPEKRRKTKPDHAAPSLPPPPPTGTRQPSPVVRGLLCQYYRSTQTLRQHLLCRLPASSRLRRRKVAVIGLDAGGGADEEADEAVQAVQRALDGVLVCTHDEAPTPLPITEKRSEWAQLSQVMADDSAVTISAGDREYCQTEVVDFVIWLLFSRNKSSSSLRAPKHLLCQGFHQRHYPPTSKSMAATSIPGLYRGAPNHHSDALRRRPWPEVLALLGRAGDAIMADMLLDGAVFVPVEAGHGNYWQLSGVPLSEVPRINDAPKRPADTLDSGKLHRAPSDIVFIRSRMMYARAALTGHGEVETGLRHIHALNRYSYTSPTGVDDMVDAASVTEKNERACSMLMIYIFPRQYGLHNVFDSPTDTTRTVQKLQDYTLREEEIFARLPAGNAAKTPKRLRGEPRRLVQRLQVLHARCSYAQMLWHYCPAPSLDSQYVARGARSSHSVSQSQSSASSTQPTRHHRPGPAKKRLGPSSQPAPPPSTLDTEKLLLASTPTAHVSAFCQAVLSKIIPDEFWGGAPDTRAHNKTHVMKHVDAFVRLRQFESMSLHDVVQGLRLADMPWLAPPAGHPTGSQKPSLSDTRKRADIFHELVYYVFDSLLMPLVRGNFYVTESAATRHRLLYFRHDVWRHIAEPAMAALRAGMFDEIKTPDAARILAGRRLGFSQIRLLPKARGVRPVVNLRRRQLQQGPPGGKKRLGPSINSVLAPVHAMLKLERTRNPALLGSSMFSVGEIYGRIKAFAAGLPHPRPRLFFAKVDVRAAFDTIPQTAVLRLMGTIPDAARRQYTIAKHVEVKPSDGAAPAKSGAGPSAGSVPQGSKRWHSAAVADSFAPFPDRVDADLAPGRKNTIFVDAAVSHMHSTLSLLTLLAEHVDTNIVKIGKKYYRQRSGVPQGSVVSSMLCNYFYGDLEARHLGFLAADDGSREGSLLMRLVDDFLLITTDEARAARFVRTMHAGVPEYGVAVNPAKTLVNFDLVVEGRPVPRVHEGAGGFPYCGTLIDCRTLEISRDRARGAGVAVEDCLTVDRGRMPGQNFRRKMLKAFQIQSHAMFFDTRHNSERAVHANVHAAFAETAAKMWAHARCLPRSRRPAAPLVVDTIRQTVAVAAGTLAGKTREAKYPGYRCAVGRLQVEWLGYHAFKEVLLRKQTAYGDVLGWLDERITELAEERQMARLPGAHL